MRSGISTAYLAVADGRAMLVDAAYDAISSKVLAKLNEVEAKLELIVLTHYHYDHVGAADTLRKATGAPVAIHRADAANLRRGGKLTVTPTRLRGKLLAPSVMRGDRAAVSPDLELGDVEDLQQYGGIGRSILTSGHTAGSVSVVLPGGTVLAGDALTESIVPRHLAEPPLFADDSAGSKASIVTIAEASHGDVRVAHIGHVTEMSLQKLAVKARQGQLHF